MARRKTNGPAYIVNPETGCWDWQLAKISTGYGETWDRESKKVILAHRQFYMNHHNLAEIPKHLVVHHRCENRACVNPEHLELVTFVTNLRISSKAKLSIDRARAIRAGFSSGKTRKELAQEFGVHSVTIGAVINNRLWAES